MKVFVKFEFDLPEDNEEYHSIVKAHKYIRFYDSLYDYVFRPVLKYGSLDNVEFKERERAATEKIWNKIIELTKEIEL